MIDGELGGRPRLPTVPTRKPVTKQHVAPGRRNHLGKAMQPPRHPDDGGNRKLGVCSPDEPVVVLEDFDALAKVEADGTSPANGS